MFALLAPFVVPAIVIVFAAAWSADFRQTSEAPTRIDEIGD